MKPAEVRRARKMSRLTEVADLYRELRGEGNSAPVQEISRRLGVTPSTARTWVYRAREAGLLPATTQGRAKASEHEPRRVDWGADSWTACALCRREWPCRSAAKGVTRWASRVH